MELQIALDRIPRARALALARALAPSADVIEVGTSLIKAHGMELVREIAAAAGPTPVLADLKTADDAATEFRMAFEAGARAATVLAVAHDATLEKAIRTAQDHGAETVVDLMATTEERRARLAADLPDEVVLAAHVAKDVQAAHAGPASLLGAWAAGRRLALAGGLGADDLPALAAIPRLRVIVGGAVTGAPDPLAAAEQLRERLDSSDERTRSGR
ncbi:3-hexulose-6-phosphate synthase [Sinomonas atrocyanea]|uniref:3-hexulose-6-phosphate synthase n=1 Tax=Sinomonas atrocyanea TaxID=37927 RepID=A0A126ZYQ3_9MICC|nr:orotidine 5'-phosphate decarboxylase / HUMPS family protein [Sinomonas atrocyanea]AMM32006.1 3-hexulose-6-phosphate synthase [Sinomonas atrocyanea]GEB65951.1 3-hexulose-6-phosphate synthase [Sinomonas atrocyanea]GGG76908.1 3-hexulose-6-phosphate synthase [Sinomonas atrocyanea]